MKDLNTFLRATGGRRANLQSKGRQTGSMVQFAGWLRALSLSCTWMECIQQAGKGLADRPSGPHPLEVAPSSCSLFQAGLAWPGGIRLQGRAADTPEFQPSARPACGQPCLSQHPPPYLLICFLVSSVHPSSALELWSVYVAPGTEWLVLEAQRGKTQGDFQGKMDFRFIDTNICSPMVFQTDHHLLLDLSFTRILEQEADSATSAGHGEKTSLPRAFPAFLQQSLPLWAEEGRHAN